MYLIEHLRKNMPSMMGKEKAKKKMIEGITDIYKEIAKEKNLALGDFPDPRLAQEKLTQMDFSKFKALDKKKIDMLENMLSVDVPKLLQLIPEEASQKEETDLTQMGANPSPFAVMKVGGQTEATVYQNQYLVAPDPEMYRADFMALGPDKNGKLTGQKAKAKMVESKLPSNVLHKVWTLGDVDKDGLLTLYEYALAMHFIKMRLDGQDLPATVPPQMLPGDA